MPCSLLLVGAGIFLAFIGIKIVGLYKKYCWDMITIMVILISMATAIYFGNWIKTVLPINLLFFLLFVQLVYVGISQYTIPATTGLDIPLLICAMFFAAGGCGNIFGIHRNKDCRSI